MVIHHHRRRYVNKLDLSSLLRAGETHEEVRWELYRRKEEREEGTCDQETERKTERGQEIMCKRLSSRTHDPGDRIQIYWFLTRLYEQDRKEKGKDKDREKNRVRRAVWCERKPGILRS